LTGIDALVFAMEAELQSTAIGAAAALRTAGLSVDLQLEARKTKWGFKHADRLGAAYVVLVGSGEAAEGAVSVKNLATGKQERVPVATVGEWIARDRAGGREPAVE
jgi:histidyl-tRNA synthetase